MRWPNFQHLLYFWMIAREGGLAGAASKLRLSASTLSAQVNNLEAALGVELFVKRGRRLVLTEMGQHVYRQAEEIFTLGREIVEATGGHVATRPSQLNVGIVGTVPKLVTQRLLAPLKSIKPRVKLVCRQDTPDRLLADLALHVLDVVLSDNPASTQSVRVYNHRLGDSALAVYGAEDLAKKFRHGFPGSLQRAPFLLPSHASITRRALEGWFDELGVRPEFVGEFDDSALLKAFGEDGFGLFAAPAVIHRELQRQYGVRRLGLAGAVRETFYAVTAERRVKHPAVVLLTEAARERLFGVGPGSPPKGRKH